MFPKRDGSIINSQYEAVGCLISRNGFIAHVYAGTHDPVWGANSASERVEVLVAPSWESLANGFSGVGAEDAIKESEDEIALRKSTYAL